MTKVCALSLSIHKWHSFTLATKLITEFDCKHLIAFVVFILCCLNMNKYCEADLVQSERLL